MKDPRILPACLAARALARVSRLTGHGGTSLPGKAALKLCPDILKTLTRGMQVVLVTGTNGKTTTTRMLEQMCLDQGLDSFSNPSGANLKAGLVTQCILHASLTGKPLRSAAILEVDEAVLHTVAGEISPAAVLVTNVFRDQLDRFGEVTGTVRFIRDGLSQVPDAVLCLNADCMLTVSAGADLPNRKLYFGIDVPLSGQSVTVSDVPRCLRCGAVPAYTYHTYAHLGGYVCPACGMRRPPARAAVTRIDALEEDASLVRFRLGDMETGGKVALPAVYNIYNAVSALAGAMALGLDPGKAAASLSKISSGFGRMEKLRLGNVDVRIILVKNPVGMSRALDYLRSVPGPFLPVFCLNDRINDGTDISWIWDVDFEESVRAFREKGLQAAAAGTRAADMRLRLRYAGMEEEDLLLKEELEDLVDIIRHSSLPVYVLPNYTAMLEIRDRLAVLSGRGRFWEEKA